MTSTVSAKKQYMACKFMSIARLGRASNNTGKWDRVVVVVTLGSWGEGGGRLCVCKTESYTGKKLNVRTHMHLLSNPCYVLRVRRGYVVSLHFDNNLANTYRRGEMKASLQRLNDVKMHRSDE